MRSQYDCDHVEAEYYTNATVEEFQLTKAQKKTLYQARLDHQVNYSALMKEFKDGNIDEDEKKQKNKELKSNFQQVMMDMTGKDKETLAAFDERVKAEMKVVKKK
ncbi:MAG: hypothetical protein JXR10_01955 [Cyclobacteriaceae bacterium]